MFFEKVIYKAYIMLASDILFDLDFNLFPELSYFWFAKYKNLNNQVRGINFAQLVKNSDLKCLFIVLQNYILFISKLKVEFVDKNKK